MCGWERCRAISDSIFDGGVTGDAGSREDGCHGVVWTRSVSDLLILRVRRC